MGAENAGTAPPKVAIWDKSNEQHQHQSIKSTIFNAQLAFFWCKSGVDLMPILGGIYILHTYKVIINNNIF